MYSTSCWLGIAHVAIHIKQSLTILNCLNFTVNAELSVSDQIFITTI